MTDIKEKIKGGDHWRVIIRPTKSSYKQDRFVVEELESIVRDAQVRLRGWYYPHLKEPTVSAQNKIGESVDWEGMVEYWEFSTAGHFGHLFTMREEYNVVAEQAKKIKNSFAFSKEKTEPINKFLEVVSTIYQFTEIYLFASKLAQSNKFEDVEKFEIIVELHGVRNRLLFIWDFLRNLWEPYISTIEEDEIVLGGQYTKEELIAKYDELALHEITKTFKCFNWKNPSEQVIRGDQKKLIDRRL